MLFALQVSSTLGINLMCFGINSVISLQPSMVSWYVNAKTDIPDVIIFSASSLIESLPSEQLLCICKSALIRS